MILRSTTDIRLFLQETICEVKAGTITNAVARTRLHAARTFLDTLKVDIAVAHLGKTLEPATFDMEPALSHSPQRRVS